MRKYIEVLNDKVIEKLISSIFNSVSNIIVSLKWKSLIEETFYATEGFSNVSVERLTKSSAINRHFEWLMSDNCKEEIYDSFIITVALELRGYELNSGDIISLGSAILDKWFESRKVQYKEIKERINKDYLTNVLNDTEKLYREYFLLYTDCAGGDVVRVYYPKNDENWINYRKLQSVDVNVNLAKGVMPGFCKVGFAYSKVLPAEEIGLKVAYINGNREMLKFDGVDSSIDDGNILWMY